MRSSKIGSDRILASTELQNYFPRVAVAADQGENDYNHYNQVGASHVSLTQLFSHVLKVIGTILMSDILYHVRTKFLFNASDLNTIVVLSTIFGVLGSYANFTQDPGAL